MTATLQRFVDAQAPVYDAVLAELTAGRKRTHWMWFVFPQLFGLGSSANAEIYGIRDIGEARDYLAHPLLGARLVECVGLAMASARPVAEVFGYPDNLKLRSCLTLFEAACGAEGSIYARALDTLYNGERDMRTLELLSGK